MPLSEIEKFSFWEKFGLLGAGLGEPRAPCNFVFLVTLRDA